MRWGPVARGRHPPEAVRLLYLQHHNIPVWHRRTGLQAVRVMGTHLRLLLHN